jgi:predicted nucleic acid-binding protein
MRIYLDAVTVIYTVEDIAPFAARIDTRLAAPGVIQVASDLTRLECRVKPLRDGNSRLLTAFDDYFAVVVGEIVPLTRQVVDRATRIRAEYRFKTPDVLHLAAAVESGCDLFLTHDSRLRRFREIQVESLA